MPLVDMSLERLREYDGRNPKPTDFEEYWEKSIAEMKAVEAKPELIPADFQTPSAECFDLYFTSVKGARIHAKYLRPRCTDKLKKFPVVLMFHGYTGNSGDWSDKLSYISEGFAIAAMDCRGQGGLSEDVGGVIGNTHHGHIIRGLDEKDPTKLLFRDIFLDTAKLAEVVLGFEEIDEDKVAATGVSQGGGLTLACAALEPRVKKAVPVYPFLCDYKRVWEMDLAIGAYSELKEYFRRFDPRHENEDETFTRLGYIDLQYLAPRIKGDILMGVGLSDTVCPPSTQFAAYNKMTCNKAMKLYPDFGHESLPGFSDIGMQHILTANSVK